MKSREVPLTALHYSSSSPCSYAEAGDPDGDGEGWSFTAAEEQETAIEEHDGLKC